MAAKTPPGEQVHVPVLSLGEVPKSTAPNNGCRTENGGGSR